MDTTGGPDIRAGAGDGAVIFFVICYIPGHDIAMSRLDGRAADQLRPITFIPHIVPSAAGSVLCCFGSTRVICTVTVEEGVPRWMKEQKVKGGWITGE